MEFREGQQVQGGRDGPKYVLQHQLASTRMSTVWQAAVPEPLPADASSATVVLKVTLYRCLAATQAA